MKALSKYIKTLILAVILCSTAGISAQSMEEAKKTFNKGLEAFKAQDILAAVESFNQVIEICAVVYEEEEDEEAEQLMYQCMEKVPALYLRLAQTSFKAKDLEKGFEYAAEAKKTSKEYEDDETYKKTLNLLGQVYYMMGSRKLKAKDFDGAIVEYDKGIAENPEYAKLYYYKAFAYKSKGDDANVKATSLKAIEVAEKKRNREIIGKTKKLAYTYFLKKGNDAKTAKDLDAAESALKDAFEFKDNDAMGLSLMASVYLDKKAYDDAIAYSEKALAVETDVTKKSNYNFTIAEAYKAKGDNASACAAYKKVTTGSYAENAAYQLEHGNLGCE